MGIKPMPSHWGTYEATGSQFGQPVSPHMHSCRALRTPFPALSHSPPSQSCFLGASQYMLTFSSALTCFWGSLATDIWGSQVSPNHTSWAPALLIIPADAAFTLWWPAGAHRVAPLCSGQRPTGGNGLLSNSVKWGPACENQAEVVPKFISATYWFGASYCISLNLSLPSYKMGH